MNPYITSATVATRDGRPFYGDVTLVEERHEQSERQRMLAAVARIEARLEVERASRIPPSGPRTGSHPMATALQPERHADEQATRFPGKLRPAPLPDLDDFGTADRFGCVVINALLIAAAALTAALLIGVAL